MPLQALSSKTAGTLPSATTSPTAIELEEELPTHTNLPSQVRPWSEFIDKLQRN